MTWLQNNVLEVIFNHLYYIFIETNLLDKLFILILWFKIVRCQIVGSVKLLVVSSCPRCQIATILTWPTESRWIWHRQVRLDSHPLAPSTCKGFKFYYFCQRISGGELGSHWDHLSAVPKAFDIFWVNFWHHLHFLTLHQQFQIHITPHPHPPPWNPNLIVPLSAPAAAAAAAPIENMSEATGQGQGQKEASGSRIVNICIMDTSIRIKDQRS